MIVQDPVPMAGVLAASVVEVPQMVWSSPAIAVDGACSKVIDTTSELGAHAPLLMVQRSEYVVPGVPEKLEVGLLLSASDPPAPLTIVHFPSPITGVLPARVVVGPQIT